MSNQQSPPTFGQMSRKLRFVFAAMLLVSIGLVAVHLSSKTKLSTSIGQHVNVINDWVTLSTGLTMQGNQPPLDYQFITPPELVGQTYCGVRLTGVRGSATPGAIDITCCETCPQTTPNYWGCQNSTASDFFTIIVGPSNDPSAPDRLFPPEQNTEDCTIITTTPPTVVYCTLDQPTAFDPTVTFTFPEPEILATNYSIWYTLAFSNLQTGAPGEHGATNAISVEVLLCDNISPSISESVAASVSNSAAETATGSLTITPTAAPTTSPTVSISESVAPTASPSAPPATTTTGRFCPIPILCPPILGTSLTITGIGAADSDTTQATGTGGHNGNTRPPGGNDDDDDHKGGRRNNNGGRRRRNDRK